jgi:hypothetical protein
VDDHIVECIPALPAVVGARSGLQRHADISLVVTLDESRQAGFQVVATACGEESESTEVDAEDWNLGAAEPSSATQEGAIAAQRDEGVDVTRFGQQLTAVERMQVWLQGKLRTQTASDLLKRL